MLYCLNTDVKEVHKITADNMESLNQLYSIQLTNDDVNSYLVDGVVVDPDTFSSNYTLVGGMVIEEQNPETEING